MTARQVEVIGALFPDLDNVLYSGLVRSIPALAKYGFGDGETGCRVLVVKERSGFTVWRSDYDGNEMVAFAGTLTAAARDAAIERAVDEKRAWIAEFDALEATLRGGGQ